MATAEQMKSLIRSHLNNEPERFYSIALQVAAHEARQGHGFLAAYNIRDIVDKARKAAGGAIDSYCGSKTNQYLSFRRKPGT